MKVIYQVALGYLAKRDYAKQALTKKLSDKGFDSKQIQMVIQQLEAEGFINEARFTENFIRKQSVKGQGPENIALRLKAEGLSTEDIAEQLKIIDNAWIDEAFKVWHKRFKGKYPANFKDRAKAIRFLQYRGFTREQIEAVLKKSSDRD